MPASAPSFLLLLLGASRFPNSPRFADKQQRPFAGSRDLVLRYFQESLQVPSSRIKNLFDSQLPPESQLREIEEFICKNRDIQQIITYYIGHGLELDVANEREYVLACAATMEGRELKSSINIRELVETLSYVGRTKDLTFFLDSCFAGQAAAPLQGQCRSIALFAASSSLDQARAAPDAKHTEFTGGLFECLALGDAEHGPNLTLSELCTLVRAKLEAQCGEDVVRPELHVPSQRHSEPQHTPLFPNPGFRGALPIADEPAVPCLLVQIEPTTKARQRRRYRVRAWLVTSFARTTPQGDLLFDSEEENSDQPIVKDKIGEVLMQLRGIAADALRRKGILDRPDFWVELILPRELLNEPFDQHSTLGVEHPVVVRCLERLRALQMPRTKAGQLKIQLGRGRNRQSSTAAGSFMADAALRQAGRFQLLKTQQDKPCPPLIELGLSPLSGPPSAAVAAWVCQKSPTGPRVWNWLIDASTESLVCAVLDEAPSEQPQSMQGDIFHDLLRAGVPVMLWSRGSQGINTQALRQFLTQMIWGEIPERVRKTRREASMQQGAHFGRDITLLWDDPQRMPPIVPLVEPSLPKQE